MVEREDDGHDEQHGATEHVGADTDDACRQDVVLTQRENRPNSVTQRSSWSGFP